MDRIVEKPIHVPYEVVKHVPQVWFRSISEIIWLLMIIINTVFYCGFPAIPCWKENFRGQTRACQGPVPRDTKGTKGVITRKCPHRRLSNINVMTWQSTNLWSHKQVTNQRTWRLIRSKSRTSVQQYYAGCFLLCLWNFPR